MLSVKDLNVCLDGANSFYILRDITCDIPTTGITGILGESGSGKSIFAKTICGLTTHPVKTTSGKIIFNGLPLSTPKSFQKVRGSGISMIFQHPTSALNPVFTIGEQLCETLLFHKKAANKKEAAAMAVDLLNRTGIAHPAERLHAYPHQLSGGMNQRVMIALGIATAPRLMIADEPTTALDVGTQKQIIDLLVGLGKADNFGILFITHNMSLLESIADNILVFYAGELIERISGDDLRDGNIKHPCTVALKKCLPKITTSPQKTPLYTIPGTIAKNIKDYDNKCIFHERCEFVQERCRTAKPRLENDVKCFFPVGGV